MDYLLKKISSTKIEIVSVFNIDNKGSSKRRRRYFRRLFLSFVLSLSVCSVTIFTSVATGATYHVAKQGSDNNDGSDMNPWLSIRKAAAVANEGDTVLVAPGVYDEAVNIKNSGTSETKRICFVSQIKQEAKCKGFAVNGDFITIDGFEVEADTTNWTGIVVNGKKNVNVLNCLIRECPLMGILINLGGENSVIEGNTIDHCGQCGISIIGFNCVVKNNTIMRTVQHHPKGSEPGFTGFDADGMKIYGSYHHIIGNTIINIADTLDEGNIDPHADGIQTSDGSKPVMSNTIIERNYFCISHPSGKGIIMEATKGNACENITIRNNIFEFRDIGVSASAGEFKNIRIYNNLFNAYLNDASWGTAIYFKDIDGYDIKNNITVDCHPEHRKIVGGSGEVDYNLAWNSDNSPPRLYPLLQEHEVVIDPQFVAFAGIHGENDFYLKPYSPAINEGIVIKDIVCDFNGTPRPENKYFDIGPYEYKASPVTTKLKAGKTFFDFKVYSLLGHRIKLEVSKPVDVPCDVIIYSLQGRRLLQVSMVSNNSIFNFDKKLPHGTYCCVLKVQNIKAYKTFTLIQ